MKGSSLGSNSTRALVVVVGAIVVVVDPGTDVTVVEAASPVHAPINRATATTIDADLPSTLQEVTPPDWFEADTARSFESS
jgi:hypothetical protein